MERRSYRESLQNHREQILLSKKLATIDTTVPIQWSLEQTAAREPDVSALKRIYRELEFFSLLRELGPAGEEPKTGCATVSTGEELAAWLASIPADAPVAVAVAGPRDGEISFAAMVGLAWRKGEARAVPPDFLDLLRAFFEDAARPKIVHDLKSALLEFWRMGVEPKGFRDDVMLYAFLLSADPSGCSAEALCERLLGRKLLATAEARAECALEIAGQLRPLAAARVRELYETIELPLAPVLARMERTGIRIAPSVLRGLSARMEGEIQRLAGEIHTLAGRPFNINSPQQLGKVLFEDLRIPAPARYGKGRTVSTAADVLEALAPAHEIAAKVLEYRQLVKLKGTYVDALPALINERTGRLHTTFNQAGAATGRLSSSNPNLQNIPIRTELGREIRAAFIPEEGWTLVAADYSQIELRLLAHMSRDALLVEAFRNGEDIHSRTAAEVFGVPPQMVTPELRRNAKAVNFGIVYGQTPFGLAAQLGIDRKDAERYIKSYFERYAGVKRFIDATIAEVRETGAAKTLFGRERPIPDINSRNPGARGFAERTAVNTPLQGTAADLIKLAMVRIDAALTRLGMQSRMLLQVHDELVFEAPPGEVAALAGLAKETMENVCRLEVPLVAGVGTGSNWRDAK